MIQVCVCVCVCVCVDVIKTLAEVCNNSEVFNKD